MSFFGNPFLYSLKQSKNVLLAGCGGGFDFTHAIPLLEHLKQTGKNCVIANLSFTDFSSIDPKTTKKICDGCILVTAKSEKKTKKKNYPSYFPEKHFCEFFDQFKNPEQKKTEVYTFERGNNIKTLQECYEKLCKLHFIDTIVLVDGGNDSLMIGNETRCGSYREDMMSIAAVYRVKQVKPKFKFLISLGYGVDYFHGVESHDVLENISSLIKTSKKGYLGVFSLLKEMEEYKTYKKCLAYISKQMDFVSIVGSSIVSSIEGHFGNHHVTKRTQSSKLFINPLMSIYFCFSLPSLAEKIDVIQPVLNTKNPKTFIVEELFYKYRKKIGLKGIRKKQKFPH